MINIWIALAVAVCLYAAFVLFLYFSGRRSAARAISGFIPDCIVLFKRLISDKHVALRYKIVLCLLLAYLIFPIDLVPDFIPVAGQFDDAIIVALALRLVLGGAGPELAAKHWPGPESSLQLLLKIARIKAD